MEYETALTTAWKQLEGITPIKRHSISFLHDTYDLDTEKKIILSLSCNIPAKAFIGILVLHYLVRCLQGLPSVTGEWISFKELVGGEGYFPTFKKRVLDTITRKYGGNPDAILSLPERFNAKSVQLADVSVVIETFKNVPILITLWRADEEFAPEANVLFDASIRNIFSTEDIVVLSEYVAHSI